MLQVFCLYFFGLSAFSQVTIASYDTQFQLDHFELKGRMWTNPGEINDGIDNDGDGIIDDLHGWNFADNNNVLWEEDSDVYDSDTILYTELKMKERAALISPQEKVWLDAKAPQYESVWRDYIGFIHGTASATTILKETTNVRVMALRTFGRDSLIPSSKETTQAQDEKVFRDATEDEIQAFKKAYVKEVYKTFLDPVLYAEKHGARAVQFGVLWQLDDNDGADLKALLEKRTGLSMSDERAELLARDFYESLLEEAKDLFRSRPHMLFLMAAGNGGVNNDATLSFPHDLPGDNTIVTGASDFAMQRAAFSSYGAKSVDVLIPTINIAESVPNDLILVSSATSVSVALLANVAARVWNANTNLSAKQVREIMYDTADSYEHLAGVVKTASIINKERAVEAARLSRFMDLKDAVSFAFKVVP